MIQKNKMIHLNNKDTFYTR